MSAFAYMLRCADGSYYVGSARGETLDKRMGVHESGSFGGYTATRRPVELVWAEHFTQITDAVSAELRLKGWSRAKKEALIAGDWDRVQWLAKRPGIRSTINPHPHAEVAGSAGPRSTRELCASFEAELCSAPQDEGRRG